MIALTIFCYSIEELNVYVYQGAHIGGNIKLKMSHLNKIL